MKKTKCCPMCLGSGKIKREFIYCDDVTKYLEKIIDNYTDFMNPINLGSGKDHYIFEVANTIKKLTGFQGEIVWDTSKPDGQKRKLLDVTKINNLLGPLEFIPLNEGLQKTIEWFNEKYEI